MALDANGNEIAETKTETPTPSSGDVKTPVVEAKTEKTYSFKEDRSDWVPRTRINEYGTKLTAAEQKAKTLEAELEKERARVRAALGVETPDPKQAEANEIREALYQMFPQMKMLEKLTEEQLQEIMESAHAARTTSQNHWERHAATMLGDLEAEVADALGLDELTATQKKSLGRAYREEAQAALAERERGGDASNDFLARHERGDKTLIKEFAKAFLGDWYEPAKRAATQQTVRRQSRVVPRGERTRTQIATAPPQIDYNNEDAFKKALIQARSGGQQ